MKKTIETQDGRKIEFKSSAALMRLYRVLFNRDILQDVLSLQGADESVILDAESMTILENITYAMAKHADPSITDDIVEWLDEFSTFGVIELLPEVLALWEQEIATSSNAKKNIE